MKYFVIVKYVVITIDEQSEKMDYYLDEKSIVLLMDEREYNQINDLHRNHIELEHRQTSPNVY